METKIIAKEISRLSSSQLSDLTSILLMEHNISATMYRFGSVPSNAFDVKYSVFMSKTGMRKLMVVKTLKELLGIGLKEAKDIADCAPIVIKEDISWSEAEELRDALLACDAKVEVKEL